MPEERRADSGPFAAVLPGHRSPDRPDLFRGLGCRVSVVGGVVFALMHARELGVPDMVRRAGVGLGTIEGLLAGTAMPGRLGLCQIVRALHLVAPIPDSLLGTIEWFTGITGRELVGGEAGAQRLERSLGLRGEEPVYAEVSLREVGQVLRQIRLDRGLTEAMVAASSLVLSEVVIQAVESGSVSLSPWLRDVLVPAVLRSLHRVAPVDSSDARFLDGLLDLPAGHLAAYLSAPRAEGGAA